MKSSEADTTDNPNTPDTGTHCLVTGAGIGTMGGTAFLVAGVACPVCVVATPAFLGAGLYHKFRQWRCRKKPPAATQNPEVQDGPTRITTSSADASN